MQNKTPLALTTKQDYILKITYSLATYRNQSNHRIAYRLLEKLKDYGYLLERYNNISKIDRKCVTYSFSSDGIKYLRDKHGFNKATLHAMYKNNIITTGYIGQ